jgi:hypothetical protein
MFESFIVADVRSSEFTQRTKVIETIPYSENFPLFAYNAMPFDALQSRIVDNTSLSSFLLMHPVHFVLPSIYMFVSA